MDIVARPAGRKLRLARYRDSLNLNHHIRLRKALHRYGRAGREIAAEKLGTQLGHAGGMARVAQEHGHRHHVAQCCARLFQCLFNIAEGLPELGVEVAGERFPAVVGVAGVAGDEDRALRSLRDHRRRECALGLPRAPNEGFLHRNYSGAPGWRSLAFLIARHIRSGVAGISTCRTPRCESASTSALATAGMAPTHPASPAPFTPSGLVRVGTGLLLMSTALMSVARGMA